MTSPDKLSKQLDDLWRKHFPLIRSRIEIIQLAVDALHNNRLTHELQVEAAREAHKLVGALGTFGLLSGSDAATQIEKLLSEESSDSVPAEKLRAYLDTVKSQVNSK
jgi:HPt (histidine-containing phosphotransfer) domain-containing protein